MHSSCKPTSSRQNHKQTPSEMLYVNLHLINLKTVPIYRHELKKKYPEKVAITTKYYNFTYSIFKLSSVAGDTQFVVLGYFASNFHKLFLNIADLIDFNHGTSKGQMPVDFDWVHSYREKKDWGTRGEPWYLSQLTKEKKQRMTKAKELWVSSKISPLRAYN